MHGVRGSCWRQAIEYIKTTIPYVQHMQVLVILKESNLYGAAGTFTQCIPSHCLDYVTDSLSLSLSLSLTLSLYLSVCLSVRLFIDPSIDLFL